VEAKFTSSKYPNYLQILNISLFPKMSIVHLVKKFPALMNLGRALPSSETSAIRPYLEAVQSCPYATSLRSSASSNVRLSPTNFFLP
jgi:hypothetical protein